MRCHGLMKFVCVLILCSVAGQAAAQGLAQPPPPRTISVSGTAEIAIQPDYVSWRLTLTDIDPDPLKAKEANDQRLTGVVDLADDLDLKAEDVQAGTISIRRVYEEDDRGRRTEVFKHYSLRREVVLILRDLDEIDEMLKALAGLGVEFSVEFGSSKMIETQQQARLQAVAAARDKASAMAEVLGQKIGVPLSISQAPAFRLEDAWSNTATNSRDLPEGADIAPGAIVVRATVEITFELINE